MKQNIYEIEKNIEKLYRGQSTGFLTRNIYLEIKKHLKKGQYNEYIPYPSSDKIILYRDKVPDVKLFLIDCAYLLKHSSILGSLFSLNITNESFGDIVFCQDKIYVYLLSSISDLVIRELHFIENTPVKFIEQDLDVLSHFERDYEKKEYIVSSFRIDTVCAKIICQNRQYVHNLIQNKQIILNYEIAKKVNYVLKDGDIFSIRRYGKYIFKGVIGKTKKDNYIILIEKYV